MRAIATTILVFFAAAAQVTPAAGPKFETALEGAQEVPPVSTATFGSFEIQFNDDLTSGAFELKVFAGVNVLQAHLHCAPRGVNGPVFAFLFGLVPGGFDVNGDLAKFTLTADNVTAGGAACQNTIGRTLATLADVADAAADGLVYANVHTTANPGGEIRGQIEED